MLILKTVAKIHILSFMKDVIDTKLSSMEDKIQKKAFIRSYKFSRPFTLVFGVAVGKYFITFSGVNDESIIVARFDAVVDLNIPILQRCSHCFNFSFDALLNRRKNHP